MHDDNAQTLPHLRAVTESLDCIMVSVARLPDQRRASKCSVNLRSPDEMKLSTSSYDANILRNKFMKVGSVLDPSNRP